MKKNLDSGGSWTRGIAGLMLLAFGLFSLQDFPNPWGWTVILIAFYLLLSTLFEFAPFRALLDLTYRKQPRRIQLHSPRSRLP